MTGILKKPSFNIFAFYLAGLLSLAGGFAVFYWVFHFSHAVLFVSFVLFFVLHGASVFLLFSKKSVALQLEKEQLVEQANLLQVDLAKTKTAIDSMQRKLKDFIKLRLLVEQLSKSFSLEQTAKTFAREVYHFFDKVNVRVFLYLFHPKTGKLMLEAAEGSRIRDMKRLGQGDVFDRWVIRTHQPLVVSDTRNDYRFKAAVPEQDSSPYDAKSLIITPLKSSHHIFGIFRLESEETNFFDVNDLRLFAMAGDLGSVAVENAGFYEQLLDIAVKDSLTGLYLRREFLLNLEKELGKRVYATTGLSLIMLDLDHFKMFNDKHGHMSGDIILKWAGNFLLDFCKERGLMACRYGGEEFCVLVPHSKEPMAMDLAAKICSMIGRHEFEIRRDKFFVTVSVGVATYPDHADSQQDLIRKADQAMYMAKKQGRNRVCSAAALPGDK